MFYFFQFSFFIARRKVQEKMMMMILMFNMLLLLCLVFHLLQITLLVFLVYRMVQDKNAAVTFLKSVFLQLQNDVVEHFFKSANNDNLPLEKTQ